MGAARERRKAMQAAGIEVVMPPKKILRSWEFVFSEAADADFRMVYEYLQKRMGEDGPQDEQQLAEKCFAIGLRFFVSEIQKEKRSTGVQLHTPADMAGAAERLQALKQQPLRQPGKVVLG